MPLRSLPAPLSQPQCLAASVPRSLCVVGRSVAAEERLEIPLDEWDYRDRLAAYVTLFGTPAGPCPLTAHSQVHAH